MYFYWFALLVCVRLSVDIVWSIILSASAQATTLGAVLLVVLAKQSQGEVCCFSLVPQKWRQQWMERTWRRPFSCWRRKTRYLDKVGALYLVSSFLGCEEKGFGEIIEEVPRFGGDFWAGWWGQVQDCWIEVTWRQVRMHFDLFLWQYFIFIIDRISSIVTYTAS